MMDSYRVWLFNGGNDASVAIAHVAVLEDVFVDLMNSWATSKLKIPISPMHTV